MTKTKNRLKSIKKKFYELERVRKHLEGLNTSYSKEDKRVQQLERRMKKEFKEYDSIEGKSLKGFFYSVLGSKEEQIEKERQEYIQASLEYEEASKGLEMMEYEIDVLEKKAAKINIVEQEYIELVKRREKEIIKSNTAAGKQLLAITQKRREHEQLQHEIAQAEKAGAKALELLNKMMSHLRNARNWGNWDMGGGKRYSTYQKHGAVDRAKELAYHVRHHLKIYQQELADIYGKQQSQQFNFNIESINSFTDLFFDNLITDWIIQQKIVNSMNSVKNIYDRVVRIQQTLAVDYESLKKENRQLDKDYKKVIEDS